MINLAKDTSISKITSMNTILAPVGVARTYDNTIPDKNVTTELTNDNNTTPLKFFDNFKAI